VDGSTARGSNGAVATCRRGPPHPAAVAHLIAAAFAVEKDQQQQPSQVAALLAWK